MNLIETKVTRRRMKRPYRTVICALNVKSWSVMCRSEDCAAVFIVIRNCSGALKKIKKRIDDPKLDETKYHGSPLCRRRTIFMKTENIYCQSL
jgi:hypothetical protein